FGSGDEEISFLYLNEKGRTTIKKHPFEGIIPNLERRWRETDSSAVREELGKYRHSKVCSACEGSRLRPEARHVLIGTETGAADAPFSKSRHCRFQPVWPGFKSWSLAVRKRKSPIASFARSRRACSS